MIDPESILKILVFGHLMSLLLFLYFIINKNGTKTTIRAFTLARLLQFVGLVIMVIFLGNHSPSIMSVVTLFFFPGVMLETLSMLHPEKLNRKELNKLIAFTGVFVIFYSLLSWSTTYRVIVASIFFGGVYLYTFIKLKRREWVSSLEKLIGIIVLLLFIVNISRGTYSYILNVELQPLSAEFIQMGWAIMLIIIAFVFPSLYLLLLIENDTKKLEEINHTKNKFFKIIGHDLKSPISQMVQLSSLAEMNHKNMPEEKVVTILKAMQKLSISGTKLLDNILDWAHSQTGIISFEPKEIVLQELIDENVALIQNHAQDKNIEIRSERLCNETIMADRNMINTVIRNLLSNAVKFTNENGCIEINCNSSKKHFNIEIKDNGIGMSKEDAKKIFNIDSEHTTLGTNNEKGTGIGLILCHEFIKMHQGHIKVESELNKGSSFIFSIPLKHSIRRTY